jgi:hypothetical protein
MIGIVLVANYPLVLAFSLFGLEEAKNPVTGAGFICNLENRIMPVLLECLNTRYFQSRFQIILFSFLPDS